MEVTVIGEVWDKEVNLRGRDRRQARWIGCKLGVIEGLVVVGTRDGRDDRT